MSRSGKKRKGKSWRPKQPETSAADLLRLTELTRLIGLHSQAVVAQAALMREDIGKYLPITMASFRHYQDVATEFIALAKRFNLSERHVVEEGLRTVEVELTYLRGQCIQVTSPEAEMPAWPKHIQVDQNNASETATR